MMKRVSILMVFLTILLSVQAQTDEAVVQSIKNDIQAVKARTRETRNLLRNQERELRKLTVELERTRATIQQNKQRERDARKTGRAFTPKPVERTYVSIYAHDSVPAPSAKVADKKVEKTKQKAPKQTEQTKPDEKSVEKKTDKKTDKQTEVQTEKTEENKVGKEGEKPAPVVNSRRISDKEALRLQKERNKYYENKLKEKQKSSKQAEKQAAKEADQVKKKEQQAAKEAAKARKKMEKEKRKTESPVASARRSRDAKDTENAENSEETDKSETTEATEKKAND